MPMTRFVADTSREPYAGLALGYLATAKKSDAPTVGVSYADEIKLPKFHFQAAGHPLEDDINVAEVKEIQKIINMEVLSEPVDRSNYPEAPLIDTMFVYKAEADGDGLYTGVRARLTVRGDQMRATTEEGSSSSPVYQPLTLCMLLTKYANDKQVKFTQMDVSGAYLTSAARKLILIRLLHKYRYGRHNRFYILLKGLDGADD